MTDEGSGLKDIVSQPDFATDEDLQKVLERIDRAGVLSLTSSVRLCTSLRTQFLAGIRAGYIILGSFAVFAASCVIVSQRSRVGGGVVGLLALLACSVALIVIATSLIYIRRIDGYNERVNEARGIPVFVHRESKHSTSDGPDYTVFVAVTPVGRVEYPSTVANVRVGEFYILFGNLEHGPEGPSPGCTLLGWCKHLGRDGLIKLLARGRPAPSDSFD